MKLAYFVHDLADAAVHRRVRMLKPHAELVLLGFRRSERPVTEVEGLMPIDLGRTRDARMGQRVAAVLRAAATGRRWQAGLAGVTVFMARQLEMLVLASLARRRIAPGAPLAYECLDIHRLMLDPGPPGIGLRALERLLLRRCATLVVSSPAFLSEHFDRYGSGGPTRLLAENKVLASELPAPMEAGLGGAGLGVAGLGGAGLVDAGLVGAGAGGRPAGPPWRIGWFGVIRCQRSLHLLADLARRLPDRVEVIMRGRPSRNVVPDFDAVVAATPGLRFLGAYDRQTELAAIYQDVHFTWAMDFYEAGLNSAWLLPNRLYEGSLNGAVPLALGSVETGRWLERRSCGVRLEEPLDAALAAFFTTLQPADYAARRAEMARLPLADLIDDAASGARFANVLEGEAAVERR
jgi:succinoglycan biosynthesis protein ExoL